MGELSEFAVQICDALHKTTGEIAAVCDRDTVIAVAGGGKRELLERRVSRELEGAHDRARPICGRYLHAAGHRDR